MLLTGWNMDEALAVSKEEGYEDGFEAGISKGIEQGERRGIEYGKRAEREELIRALDGVLPVETIAEKFHLSKEYVLSVLQEPMYVSEAKVPYINAKAQTE